MILLMIQVVTDHQVKTDVCFSAQLGNSNHTWHIGVPRGSD